MIRQFSGLVSVALTLAALPGAAQNYCYLLDQPLAVGANPPRQTANEILKTLSDIAPFNYDSIKLRDARNPDLKAQGAAAEVCRKNERWIFYDPEFIEQIQTRGKSYWPSYFVFAHEVAHHFNNDPLFHRPEQERQADRAAAQWLTRLGASADDLQNSINSFVLNEQSEPNYPSRCERLKGVIAAYNEEAKRIRSQGGDKPDFKVSGCTTIAEVASPKTDGYSSKPTDPNRMFPHTTPTLSPSPTVVLECECDQCEHGGGGAVWIFEGGHGQAMWHYGAIADMTISSFDGRNFTIHRVDPAGSYSSRFAPKGQLFKAEYTGSMEGNHLTGKVFGCTWTGESPQAPCGSSASCPLTSDQMLELGKNAAGAGLKSAARQAFRMAASMGNPTAKALVDLMSPSAAP